MQGPKGAYELTINGQKKSLFEMNFDNIKRVKEKYNVSPIWLIMTSRENDLQTREFFENKKYFDYDKNKIIFFKQGEMPILDINGKMVLENRYTIKEASNGNGDVFRALNKSNIISKLKEIGIKYLYFGGIDNILANPMDYIFLGLMIAHDYKIAAKSIFKEEALEKEAVFCKINGKPSILGYDYITKEMSNLKDNDGKYLYRDKNILAHLMTIEVIEKAAKLELEYHRVYRKNTYLDINSDKEKYIREQSFKFEKFIFDIFKKFDEMLLLRVSKEKEFAPIKNLEGNYSVKSATKLYNNYWNNWRENK